MTEELLNCPSLKGEKISALRCKMKQREDSKFWGDKSKQMTGCPCQKTGEDMAKTGTCENCGRPGLTMSDSSNKCHQCNSYVAGTNKDPALRKQRLAEAKALYKDLAPGEKLPFGVKKTLKAHVPSTMRVGPKVKKLDKPEPTADASEIARSKGSEPPPAVESHAKLTDLVEECAAIAAATPPVKPDLSWGGPTIGSRRRTYPGEPLESIFLSFAAADQDLFNAIIEAAQTNRRDPAQHILWMCEGYLHYEEEIREMSLAGGAL